MPDKIEIINRAFVLLKHRRITSLEDNSEQAVVAALSYDVCQDAVLEAHPWNFASYRVGLTQSVRTPNSTWDYQYPLPTDPYCLKVRDFNPDDVVPTGWEIGMDTVDGRVLWTNQSSAKIRYTARQLDLNIWAPLAVMALTYLLASDFAIPVTGQRNKSQEFFDKFQTVLREAMTSDGREGSPVVLAPPTGLTRVR